MRIRFILRSRNWILEAWCLGNYAIRQRNQQSGCFLSQRQCFSFTHFRPPFPTIKTMLKIKVNISGIGRTNGSKLWGNKFFSSCIFKNSDRKTIFVQVQITWKCIKFDEIRTSITLWGFFLTCNGYFILIRRDTTVQNQWLKRKKRKNSIFWQFLPR